MVDIVTYRCKKDEGHFKIEIDLDEELRELPNILRSNIKCYKCKSDLELVRQDNEIKIYSEDKIIRPIFSEKTSVAPQPYSRNYYSKLREAILPKALIEKEWNEFDKMLDKNRPSGAVSSHISQMLPVMAATKEIALAIQEKGNVAGLNLQDFTKIDGDAHKHLSYLRLNFIKKENKLLVTGKGKRPSAGFPCHFDEDMPRMYMDNKKNKNKRDEEVRKRLEQHSWRRFTNTLYGGIVVRNNNEIHHRGALYELGLVYFRGKNKRNVEIILTPKGLELAKLGHHLLDTNPDKWTKGDLENKFDEHTAKWFWKHINGTKELNYIDSVKKEKRVLNIIIDLIRETKHIDDIIRHKNLEESLESLESTGQKSYISSLLNRWAGLGILERVGPSKYQSTKLGIKLYEEEFESTRPWNRQKPTV